MVDAIVQHESLATLLREKGFNTDRPMHCDAWGSGLIFRQGESGAEPFTRSCVGPRCRSPDISEGVIKRVRLLLTADASFWTGSRFEKWIDCGIRRAVRTGSSCDVREAARLRARVEVIHWRCKNKGRIPARASTRLSSRRHPLAGAKVSKS